MNMTDEEIIAAADACGLMLFGLGMDKAKFEFCILAFAKFVGKIERFKEREACAKVCDDEWDGDADTYEYSIAANDCAAAIRAKEALAQPEQEPWCMKMNGCKTKCEDCPVEVAQPEQEPIYQYQMANGSWIDQTKESHDYNVRHGQATVRVVHTAPPQLEQEPVADDFFKMIADKNPKPFSSLQRRWVGLTDEEIDAIYTGVRAVHHEINSDLFARAIESKLKEKNGYSEEKNT